VLEYFEKDELTCINLEGTFTDQGHPVQKAHTFRGPTSYVNILTQNSVEFVTLANNHTMDYGQSGYDSTVATLKGAGIPYVERDCSTIVTTANGLKVGFYGAVYYLMETEVITEAIRQLREEADIVVFVPHWGYETNHHRNEEQLKLAHAVIDAGADIVWGSHPHVLQEIEVYNDAIIFYSLGNFSFGGNIAPDDYDSALIQQEVIRAADGTVSLGETIVVPVRISTEEYRNNFQPIPYIKGSEDYLRVLEKLALAEKN
jgi:poly-gamma-glutamate synthesis protein (capsule biosynthesis protein)